MAFGKNAKAVMDFKESILFKSDEKLYSLYASMIDSPIHNRKSALTKPCLKYILNNITGESVMDAACGNGFLLSKVKEKHPGVKLFGTDLSGDSHTDGIIIKQANICSMPYDDKSFDTVLCTHAIEHIRESKKALSELIRICKKRLIIVVPRQREFRFTMDSHVNFFPYLYNLKAFVGIEDATYFKLKGDHICVVDFDN